MSLAVTKPSPVRALVSKPSPTRATVRKPTRRSYAIQLQRKLAIDGWLLFNDPRTSQYKVLF